MRATTCAATAARLQSLARATRACGCSTKASLASADDADRETNRWLGPLFVAIIFAFTSIAVVNTLVMIALRRDRELALLRLSGATKRQVRSMARWEAALIVAIGLGVGLAIAATALVPLTHSLTGGFRPYIPLRQLGLILGGSTVLAVIALAIPTRRALRTRPITALASPEVTPPRVRTRLPSGLCQLLAESSTAVPVGAPRRGPNKGLNDGRFAVLNLKPCLAPTPIKGAWFEPFHHDQLRSATPGLGG